MNRLVITCHADGSVETLLKGSVFDTRQLGERKIERITIIEWSTTYQLFYIKWLKGPKAGEVEGWTPNSVAKFFETYEEAVSYEVEQVNKMRLEGVSFA